MELRHLRYFVAVAEEENVSRAALRLHVSQPPLTRQIHDLEHEVGVAFFVRHGKSIRLTMAGRVFLQECRAVLARVDAAVNAAILAGKQQPLVHLGYAPSPSKTILTPFRRHLAAASPGVRLKLHDLSSPGMITGLKRGELQAALMMEPLPGALGRLKFCPLLEFAMGVLVTKAHPLARRRGTTVEEVLTYPAVVFSRQDFPDYHAMLRRVLRQRVKKLERIEECDSGPSLMAAIEGSAALAIVPRPLADAAGRRFRFVPFSDSVPHAVLGLCIPDEQRSPQTRYLIDAARAAAREAATRCNADVGCRLASSLRRAP